MDPIVTALIAGREPNDCVIATLAMYLNTSYEDALRAVTTVDKEFMGKRGLWVKQTKKAAKLLGQPLKLKKKVDMDSDYGMLMLCDHCTILRNGLIIDPDGTVWDWEDFLHHYEYSLPDVEGLLVVDPKFPGISQPHIQPPPERIIEFHPARPKRGVGGEI